MSRIEFGDVLPPLQGKAIELAKAGEPNFELARATLAEVGAMAINDFDELKANIFIARNTNDLGVVDVREGLYNRSRSGASDDEALESVWAGIDKIEFSYYSLTKLLSQEKHELTARRWVPGVHGHIAATMNTWFRATQTAQLLDGDIGIGKKVSPEALDAQWMIGDGTPEKPGAKVHAREGDNGYWATQTHFLSVRGNRINGGGRQFLSAVDTVITEGIPEVAIRLLTDRKNARQMVATAGRLSLESLRREKAIAAVLDYQKF